MKQGLLVGTVIVLAGWGAQAQNFPETKLTASDGAAGDEFGWSVAVSGGTVLVGARADDVNGSFSGSAYLFDADGAERQKLIASDGAAGDQFGYSVALSGGTALVGAPLDEPNGFESGSAYLFDADGTETKLTASDGAAGERFGWSVALSGDTVLVGAFGDNDKGADSGSAYSFDAEGSETKLTASDGAEFEFFGWSVALSGGTALVGAPTSSNGSAYLFDADGTQTQKLTASDGAAADLFGFSVALSGDTALVGARAAAGNAPSSGAAYLFDSDGTETKLTASDGAADDWFGLAVALSGNLALVGAPFDDDRGASSGSAYLFDARTGAELAKLTASDGTGQDGFGWSVALDGSTAVVGAYRDDTSRGAAYVYDLSPTWTALFGGAYDDAGNWNVFAPGTLGLDVKIDPDSTQTITGPAGASEVGRLFLGHGDGVATLDLQAGGGIVAADGAQIGANGVLRGDGGLVGDIANAGEIVLDGLNLAGNIENRGVIAGSGRVGGDLFTAPEGELRLGEGDRVVVGGLLANAGDIEVLGATLPGAAPSELDVRDGLENGGDIVLVGGRSVIQGDVENLGTIATGGAGETIFFDDVMNAGLLLTGAGSATRIAGDYAGPGGLTGGGLVEFLGGVSTGASPTLQTYAVDILLGATSETLIEIAGTDRAAGQYDAWDVTGSLTLGGTLSLAYLDGFFARPGDSFTLFTATDGIAGDFAALDLAPLAQGSWREVRTTTSYGFAVAPIPLPAGAWLLLSGLGLLALRRRG